MISSIRNFLSPERTQVGVSVSSKELALRHISVLIADQDSETSPEAIFEGFVAREDMGSTGIGGGIAIPHCRLERGVATRGALIRLADPIDFDSVDRMPVDLMFALLVPEDDAAQHLRALALLAHRFNQPAFRQALRESPDPQSLYALAVESEGD